MESLYDINGEKLTALELQVLAHITLDCEGVFECDVDDDHDIRSLLDTLVLSGFIVRGSEGDNWVNRWTVTDDVFEELDPYVDVINHTLDSIAEA